MIVTAVMLSVSPESGGIRLWANSAAIGSLSVLWLIWRTLTTKFTCTPARKHIDDH
jgi:hypothetical protein